MGYRRLFIMRKDLNMSAGKLAAQVGHCAELYWLKLIEHYLAGEDKNPFLCEDGTTNMISMMYIPVEMYDEYIDGAIVKTICEARNKNHLLKAKAMAEDLGLIEGADFGLVYDKCLTELIPEEDDGTTLTGIWFKPLEDEIAHQISKKYHLYM